MKDGRVHWSAGWPRLRLSDWRETRDTMHIWTQIIGKVRMAHAPLVNYWWQATLYVTRGLTTSTCAHTPTPAPDPASLASRAALIDDSSSHEPFHDGDPSCAHGPAAPPDSKTVSGGRDELPRLVEKLQDEQQLPAAMVAPRQQL